MNGLLELAERCEQATGPDEVLDGLIGVAIRYGYEDIGAEHELEADNETGSISVYVGKRKVKRFRAPPFTASIDSAMTLVPEGWLVEKAGEYPFPDDVTRPFFARLRPREFGAGERVMAMDGATLPLTLCAAALRARVSETHKPSPDHPSEIPVE